MLEKVESPRLKAGKVSLVEMKNGRIQDEGQRKHFSAVLPYIEHYEDRFNAANTALLIKDYKEIHIDDGKEFDKRLNEELSSAEEWVLLDQNGHAEKSDVRNFKDRYILNPGTLHLGDGYALFSKHALSLRRFGYDRIAHTQSFKEIISMWQKDKVVQLDDYQRLCVWDWKTITAGKRYVIWGTGLSGSFFADAVQRSGGTLVLAVDKDPSKEGKEFYGARICQPGYLSQYTGDYDYLLIGNYSQFGAIKEEAMRLGVREEKIRMPYEA